MAKPDWRDAGAGSPDPSRQRPWQTTQSSGQDPNAQPSRRGVKRALAVILLVGITVALGALILLLRANRPACLILVGSGYENNLFLPHNAHGWHGGLRLLRDDGVSQPIGAAEGFLSRFLSLPAKMRRVETPIEFVAKEAWDDTWKKIAAAIDAGTEEENVVIYLSAHGYADEEAAYLLRNVPDVRSVESFNQSRIKFDEVLESLKKVDRKKKVLLILDVCHVESHWPIGMLQNDFAVRLEDKYSKDIKGTENLIVICSAGAGKRSWSSDDAQTSMFAQFVAQGLKEKGRSDRVTAADLFGFVEKKSNDWARNNRARLQNPLLIGNGADATELVRITDAQAPVEHADKDKKGDGDAGKGIDAKTATAELKKEWQTWRDLKRNHAPDVHAPHYWRLYQETLLRYEQLLRAGDPTGKAAPHKSSLGELAIEIRKARVLDKALDCAGNCFPMPAVLGYRPDKEASEQALRAYLDNLVKADADQRKKSLDPLVEGKLPYEKQYYQTRLSRMLLNAELGQAKIDRATLISNLAQVVADFGVHQLASEVHLVNMLSDAHPDLDSKTIRLALESHVQAQEIALSMPKEPEGGELYSEVIFQRFADRIVAADNVRRKGEDLLFGDPAKHSSAAEDQLLNMKGNARELYTQIRTESQQMRLALLLRDRIAADLPFLALGLANMPAVDNPAENEKEIRALQAKIEPLGLKLAELIDVLDRPGRPLPEAKWLEATQVEFDGLRDKFHKLGVRLADKKADDLPKNWHALDAVLSIPPTVDTPEAVELRIALLEQLRKTSIKLAGLEAPKANPDADEDRVALQRKLLRACLKSDEKQLRGPDKNVDERIRDLFLGLPDDIVKKSREKEDIATLLSGVDRCRIVPGGLADQVRDKKLNRLNPARDLRHVRMYHLLDWLAQRTVQDHWFEPGAAKEGRRGTYYLPAAQAFLTSAAGLVDPASKLRKECDEKKAALKEVRLKILDTPSRYWTTEREFKLTWNLGAPAGVPEGVPMTWLEVVGGSAKKEPWLPKSRDLVAPWPLNKPFPATFGIAKKDIGDSREVKVVFHALYRGQHEQIPLDIECPLPDVVVKHTPGSEKVAFATRMEKPIDFGAVTIVLDTSASMKEKVGDKKTRFEYAQDALKELLEKVPPGTPLSIIAFSGPGNADSTPEFFVDPCIWQRGMLDDVGSRLDNLPRNGREAKFSLNNNSPIASGIIMGMEKGIPEKFPGPKVVIVLSDGMDNCSFDKPANTAKNPQANNDAVRAALRKAKNVYKDIDVIVVCFIEENDKEYPSAEAQFKHLENFNDRSGFFPQNDAEKLAKAIEDAAFRPHVQMKKGAGIVRGFEAGRAVNYHNEQRVEWEPGVAAGDFRAAIMRSAGKEAELKMPPGHNLFAAVKRDPAGRGLYLERGILGEQPEVKNRRPAVQKQDWLVTLLANEKEGFSTRRTQHVIFEKTKFEKGTIAHSAPGFVWLEWGPPSQVRTTLKWGNDPVIPAPAFQISMDDWLSGRPELTSWFWPGDRESFLSTRDIVKRRTVKLGFYADDPNDPIESVEAEPGGIAIRLRYKSGEPIFAALEAPSPHIPTEQSFFYKAGRCTLVLQYASAPAELNLVLVNVRAFKEAAAKGDTRVDLAPDSDVPVPPIFREHIKAAIK
jgi:hypothetical protein